MPRHYDNHDYIDGIEMKLCLGGRCGELHRLEDFYYNCKTWDNLETICKICKSIARKEKTINKKKEKYFNSMKKIYGWIKDYKELILDFQELSNYDLDVQRAEYFHQKRIKKNISNKERRTTDLAFRLKDVLRSRVIKAVKDKNKTERTARLIGCSINELKDHLEAQFQEGMTWENYAKWHIDHIVPCNFFDFSIRTHQLMCFNYRNLQPLWGPDNIEKSDIIDEIGEKKLKELEEIFHDDIDINNLADSFIVKKEENETKRRERITDTVTEFNQTPLGKQIKQRSHGLRSATMEALKEQEREIVQERGEKQCKGHCGRVLSLSNFHKKNDAKDGYHTYCNECVEIERKKSKKKVRGLIFGCIYCDSTYKLRDSVIRHIKEKHPNESLPPRGSKLIVGGTSILETPKTLSFKKTSNGLTFKTR